MQPAGISLLRQNLAKISCYSAHPLSCLLRCISRSSKCNVSLAMHTLQATTPIRLLERDLSKTQNMWCKPWLASWMEYNAGSMRLELHLPQYATRKAFMNLAAFGRELMIINSLPNAAKWACRSTKFLGPILMHPTLDDPTSGCKDMAQLRISKQRY